MSFSAHAHNTDMVMLMRTNNGFSLVEIIITLAIASIIISAGVPALTGFVEKNRIATATNTVVLALNLARSEAIKRRVQVTMRRGGSTQRAWEEGWSVFTDNNGNGQQDPEDMLLTTFPELAHGYTLRTGGNFRDWIAYLPTGVSRSGNGLGNDTFRVCPPDGDASKANRVVVNQTGRPRLRKIPTTCP